MLVVRNQMSEVRNLVSQMRPATKSFVCPGGSHREIEVVHRGETTFGSYREVVQVVKRCQSRQFLAYQESRRVSNLFVHTNLNHLHPLLIFYQTSCTSASWHIKLHDSRRDRLHDGSHTGIPPRRIAGYHRWSCWTTAGRSL